MPRATAPGHRPVLGVQKPKPTPRLMHPGVAGSLNRSVRSNPTRPTIRSAHRDEVRGVGRELADGQRSERVIQVESVIAGELLQRGALSPPRFDHLVEDGVVRDLFDDDPVAKGTVLSRELG